MTNSVLATILLAGEFLLGAGDLGAASRRASRSNASEALVWLVIVGGLIAVVCLAIRFGTRLQRRRRFNSHASLFQGLCRTHGLDHSARRLLKQVARHHRLAQPARLFTEPKWLDPAKLRGGLRRRAGEVFTLRNRLFA
ncbi:MAG: hypothetical protein ACYSWU_10740 [Planctomycetota bacterium]|jgi:hypothetical protein